jgi:hypothetical protein
MVFFVKLFGVYEAAEKRLAGLTNREGQIIKLTACRYHAGPQFQIGSEK